YTDLALHGASKDGPDWQYPVAIPGPISDEQTSRLATCSRSHAAPSALPRDVESQACAGSPG
ncbi:MAG: hypothetical protein LQ347_005594, partial [Umbilicaria vellea]